MYVCLFNLCVAGAHGCECLCTCGHMHGEPEDSIICLPLSLSNFLLRQGLLTNPVLINSCQDVYPACPCTPSLTVNTETMGSCQRCLPLTRALQILIQSSPLHTNHYLWSYLPLFCFVCITALVYIRQYALFATTLPPLPSLLLLIPPSLPQYSISSLALFFPVL